jgi:hypothetical protein
MRWPVADQERAGDDQAEIAALNTRIENLIASYNAKVADFAAETLRASNLHSILSNVLTVIEREQGFHNAQELLKAAREATRGGGDAPKDAPAGHEPSMKADTQ